MKFRRFCTVFLLLALLLTQLWPVTAYAVEDIQLDAKAALLVDGATGTVLLDQDAHTKQYPASITKVMTALLVFEAIDRGELRLSDSITASANSVAGLPDDASTADIVAGETLTVEQLLYCLLVVSANEVSNILAEAVSGSVTAFVALMNQRAQELGCENTHFVNTSGLPDNEHYTTAWDIYLFTREAMKYDEFMTIVNTKAYDVPATNKSEARELHSTNYLISNWRATGYLYSGAQGIKTGSTDAAGYCLVSSAVRTDRQLISVVLGARLMTDSDGSYKVGSFTETARLFDWGFDNFTTKTVLTEDEMIQEVPVALSKETAQVAVHPAYTAEAVLPDDLKPEDLVRTVTLDADVVDAPVSAGQQLGTITLSYGDVDYATVPLLAVAVVIVIRYVGPFFTALQNATDELNLVVQENLNAVRVVKSFVREDEEEQKFRTRSDKLRDTAERAFGFVVMFMPLMILIMGGTIVSLMWLGGHQVAAGTLLSGDLLAFFTYASEILMSLMMVSMVLMILTRAIACGKRIVEVLDEQPQITDAQADPALTVENGDIRFDHVYFKYHTTAEDWNLTDIDLHIESGMTVGILGGTGSAKSTLVSMIPRLYEVDEGAVYVGGRNVKDYTMEALRSGCAMVLQKNTLFSGTIRENLRWGRADATDAEIEEACRMACADEFIQRMPDGYDTYIEQGGTNVSGGQKQRLCIARAILRRPKVLILDDSTSAVDTATDAKIRGALKTALPGATKLIIAQRITSVMDADMILVMDDGRVVGQGTHAQLMESCEIYREVYESQQEGVSIDG